jgi:hypothetical protein
LPTIQDKTTMLKGGDADAGLDSPPHGRGYFRHTKLQAP